MKCENLKINPRFNDCDPMGHVNNAVFLSYTEEARIHFFKQLLPENWNWKENGIIIKKHEIIYFKQIYFDDIIEIKTEIKEIRNSSFKLNHKIIVENNIRSSIDSTLVYFNYYTNTSKSLDSLILNHLKNV
jgi:acyl-CoA thioester hydrolase